MRENFEEHFYDNKTKLDRDFVMLNAYHDAYPQVDVANYLNVSTSLISKIIKSGYSILWGVTLWLPLFSLPLKSF